MYEKPDDVPSLEELGAGDDSPEYWAESTTITVDRYVKQTLDEDRDGQPWNQYLESLRRAKADPLTLSDAEEIIEYLENQLDITSASGADRVTLDSGSVEDIATATARKTAEEVVGALR